MKDNLTFIFGPGSEGRSTEHAAKHSTRSFVRSEAELAVYDANRRPTGHVLTAWEAYTSFGIEVLDEAVEYGSAVLKRSKNSTGEALRRRRMELDLPHRSVGTAAKVPESDVETAESFPNRVPLAYLERVAFTLGLDERLLAFESNPGGDSRLAYRLRTLVNERDRPAGAISRGTALLFAEAASIIRVQCRLQEWLGIRDDGGRFIPHGDYGSPMSPTWQVGYNLAESARGKLQLDGSPIDSMRQLVEDRLGIPVIQALLPVHIAGATVVTIDKDGKEVRGVVLNTVGDNGNVWIRRATLAHELGHLLYDPDSTLESVRVDTYVNSQKDPQTETIDYVEQRANAFAIAFLAPNQAVSQLAPPPVSEESITNVMHTFGISHTAARYHVANAHYRQFKVPARVIDAAPSDEQTAAENFAIDYFPLSGTPEQRRGKFAGLVVASHKKGLISKDTAALYLRCSPQDFRDNLMFLHDIYEV